MMLEIIGLMVVTLIIHEVGHIMVLEKNKIPYKRIGLVIEFKDTFTAKDNRVLMAGVLLGLFVFLGYFIVTPIPEWLALVLLAWYIVGCRHDIKTMYKNRDRGF